MILTGVFLVLFTAWMLLLWIFGESLDIRWMRNWCAGIFVTLAIFLCLGGGAWITRRWIQAEYRRNMQDFADLMIERVREGRTADVEDAIRHLSGKTEDWAARADILQRLAEVNDALRRTDSSRLAERSSQKH